MTNAQRGPGAADTTYGVVAEAPSILIVDDHPPSYEALEAILAPLDARLVRATSGADAVSLARGHAFALVLLDLQMPELDGFETAAHLKRSSRSRPLPIIIITPSEPTRALVERGYASGAVDFLSKPFDAHAVRSKVAVFVELHRQRVTTGRGSEPRLRGDEHTGRVSERLLAAVPSGDPVAEIVEALVRVHDALTGVLDVAAVAERFVGEATRLCPADGAVFRYTSYGTTRVATAGCIADEVAAVDVSSPMLSPSLREGRAVRIDDTRPSVRELGLSTRHELRSLLVVPVMGPLGVAAVLALGSDAVSGFSARDEELVVIATRHAAAALANALLYEHAGEARERAELAELEMRAHGTRLRMALDSSGLGTWEYNPRGSVLRLDERACALHGVSDDDVAAFDTLLARVHTSDRARMKSAVLRALGGHGELEQEYRVTHGTEVRWLDVRGQAFSEGGQVVRFLGTVMDVTARKRVDEERSALLLREQEAREAAEQARARAEEASRAKDQFLATVSHELRNPLGAILGWSHVLVDECSSLTEEKLRRGVEVIARNARAQVQLVEDLLEVSRIVSGKLRLSTATVDVRTAVLGALDTARTAANARGVGLEVTFESDPGSIDADGDRVAQILWNLLSNAVKFTPSGGFVRVNVRRTSDRVLFDVSDSGEGIAPEFLPHVFDLFRQADGSTTRRHGGLGLGLAIVKHLVELHGGSVSVASAGLGLGATFSAQLPACVAVLQVDAKPVRAVGPVVESTVQSRGAPLEGLHLLVVDDEEDMRDLVAMVLEKAGAGVRVAPSVDEAVALANESAFDVIISDLAMPNEDGYDLVRRLRSSSSARVRQTPVLAMTAYARNEDRRRVLAAGFVRHVSKPVEPSRLVATVVEVTSPRARALSTAAAAT